MKSTFSQQVADRICDLTATNPSGIRRICDANKDLPDPQTIYRWMNAHESFREQYARAKDAQMQILADQIIDLADTDRICRKRTIKGDGSEEVVILDQVERSKLQIDSRKWLLSKLAPRKYGDRVEQWISGPDGGPIQAAITVEFVRPNGSGESKG